MCRGIEKIELKYCEDAILDLIHLTVNTTDMVVLKKPGIVQEIEKLYVGVLVYEIDIDFGHAYSSPFEYGGYDVLSEDSDTGEVVGFRNL